MYFTENIKAVKKNFERSKLKEVAGKTINMMLDEAKDAAVAMKIKHDAHKVSEELVYIQCIYCGHCEEINKELFAKIIGGAMVGFGGVAWTSFLFAGTGFAFPLCLAIVAGGTALTAYSRELTEWFSKRYECVNCGMNDWNTVTGRELELTERLSNIDDANFVRYNSVTAIPILQKLYEDAEEYIYISYGWITLHCIEDDLPYLQRAAMRGVKIVIYFGIEPIRDHKTNEYRVGSINQLKKTFQAVNYLKIKLRAFNQVRFVPTDTHTKIIVCEKYTLHGSHNLLSYRPSEVSRSEFTDKIYSKKMIAVDCKTILNQKPRYDFEDLIKE